eukprot:SAG11_NODE_1730_length_4364_cov_1.545369_1_plen_167_part_00
MLPTTLLRLSLRFVLLHGPISHFGVTTRSPGTPPPFRAYFTPDSPTEFSVFPTEGVLEAQAPGEDEGAQAQGEDEGAEGGGTPFVISYAPREYGKKLVGRLVILTAEMQWTYEVRGQHPTYVAPEGNPVVDSRLSFEMASQLEAAASMQPRRNYVKDNMAAARVRK